MDDVVISWSVENWITVILMVALAYALVVLATKLAKGQSITSLLKPAPQS